MNKKMDSCWLAAKMFAAKIVGKRLEKVTARGASVSASFDVLAALQVRLDRMSRSICGTAS